jgi:hypothetical protein
LYPDTVSQKVLNMLQFVQAGILGVSMLCLEAQAGILSAQVLMVGQDELAGYCIETLHPLCQPT